MNFSVVSSGNGLVCVHVSAHNGRPKENTSHITTRHTFFAFGIFFEFISIYKFILKLCTRQSSITRFDRLNHRRRSATYQGCH